ncbi:hypothetical protein LTS09_006819 [Friedmanniomyces endolithicus]|nr:hypothetical protein LTS09_006819 [Friedmanniomyces endolithicus]
MSLTTLPSTLRATLSRTATLTITTTTPRTFSTTPPRPASILFALNALSNSRETQHFAKLSHLPRTEHSPPLNLIKTSEVDAYPLPSPPPAVPLIRLPGTVPRTAATALLSPRNPAPPSREEGHRSMAAGSPETPP